MRIRFAKPGGRSYGYNSLASLLAPVLTLGVRGPLRKASGYGNSVPASREAIGGDAVGSARSFINHSEDELNTGPTPNRIDRPMMAANAGIIGRGLSGWPYDGNALHIPHQLIPRRPMTVTPFSRTIDTGVTIPAIPIGGPV